MDFVFSGPTCSGKSTIAEVVVRSTAGLHLPRSCTTRPQKSEEINGRNYDFLRREIFSQMIENDEFEEYAEVHGNLYGTPKSETRYPHLLFEIDCQGARTIKTKRPQACTVFILARREEIERRLVLRGRDSAEEISWRLASAAREITHASNFDCWVENADLEVTIKRLKGLVAYLLMGGKVIPSVYRDRSLLEEIQSTFVPQPA